ncbi:MAG: winged helix-turn-helix domain-containing protein [Thermodesulfobacteriota bacterium]
MNCEKCNALIDQEDAREHHGRILCEDCYMDALSPAKTCDPWAAYSAKSTAQRGGTGATLTATQEKILRILEETGGIEPAELMKRLDLPPGDFDRQIAALRHMEKLRAELRDGIKVICLW